MDYTTILHVNVISQLGGSSANLANDVTFKNPKISPQSGAVCDSSIGEQNSNNYGLWYANKELVGLINKHNIT